MSQVISRLLAALEALPEPLQSAVAPLVKRNDFRGQFSAVEVGQLQQATGLSLEPLLQSLLPLAAAYARVPVSGFHVGVWVQGGSGAIYAGANQEYRGQALGMTVHAEQAAVTHAWQAGEQLLTHLAVTAAPCGHCRQFLNELNQAEQLQVHISGQPVQALPALLPSAFGPADLGIDERLLADRNKALLPVAGDGVVDQVRQAAQASHAPYSGNLAACGLVLEDGSLVLGRVAENAAFNPTMMPLQAALLALRWRGLSVDAITRGVLVETAGADSSLATQASTLLHAMAGLTLEVYLAQRAG